MCKSELYRQILGTVSQETEISEERILSKAKKRRDRGCQVFTGLFPLEAGISRPGHILADELLTTAHREDDFPIRSSSQTKR
jgi:hypothetical protein